MKRHAGAADRNKAPIADALTRVLPKRGSVLEIASGTGQHAIFFAERFPDLLWQPSDIDSENLDSIRAWAAEHRLQNLLAPVRLDVTETHWPVERADVVLCINMIHIAPWSASLGLLAGAARVLDPGAPLVLYGPFQFAGEHTAPSNAAFDARLRSENPEWGVRDADQIRAVAEARGLAFAGRFAMPANNFMLVLRRTDTSPVV